MSTTYALQSFETAVTFVQRTTGASTEDAEKIVRSVATFAIAEYKSRQPETPQGVTMAEVKAYVDGRMEGVDISPLEAAAARASVIVASLGSTQTVDDGLAATDARIAELRKDQA